jgi:hypothetical protein
MPPGIESTACFIVLLRHYTSERHLLGDDDLSMLLDSPEPYNPVDKCRNLVKGQPESYHAMKKGFAQLLPPRRSIDWDEIKKQVRVLKELLKKEKQGRDEASPKTRLMALGEPNEVFNYSEWASAWSARDLERLLGLFAEDAVYLDKTFDRKAEGKCGLRKLFATFFHAFDWKMKVSMALRAPPADIVEVELQWERAGSRIPTFAIEQSFGSGNVRGKSNLFLKTGRVCKCVDSWNKEDIERIALRRLGFDKPSSPGIISTTDPDVSVDRIQLLKVLKLKTNLPDPDTGERGTDGKR